MSKVMSKTVLSKNDYFRKVQTTRFKEGSLSCKIAKTFLNSKG